MPDSPAVVHVPPVRVARMAAEPAMPPVAHGPFCPAFRAPAYGRFPAVEATGPCACGAERAALSAAVATVAAASTDPADERLDEYAPSADVVAALCHAHREDRGAWEEGYRHDQRTIRDLRDQLEARDAELATLRAEVHALERPHRCVAAGMSVARCRDTDLCDCFGGATAPQRLIEAEGAAMAAVERALTAEETARAATDALRGALTALRAVDALVTQIERDDRDHLHRFGQHLPGSPVVIAERLRAILPAAPEEDV